MDTPSPDEPASPVTSLSVELLGPGGVPEPPNRERPGLVPLMALLILMAFGGGYLLARSPGRSVLPDATLATTTTVRPTTSTAAAGEAFLVQAEPAGWFALPPPVPADGVTLASREAGSWVEDVAVDSDGYIWALGSGVATRWNPADATHMTFGEEVFGYATPHAVAAGQNGMLWIAAGSEVFRFDGTWARFRSPDPDEQHVTELDTGPNGELVAVTWGDWFATLYRTGPDGDLASATAFDLPIADVTASTYGPRGEVLLAGSDDDGWGVFTLEGNRLSLLPLPALDLVFQMVATDRVWVTDPEGRALYGLENDEWVEVDLPDTGPAPWGGRFPWTIGASSDQVWAAASAPDGSGLQLVEIEEPGSYVTYPPFDGASGFVSTVEVAADGVVWMGTEAGLCSFDPSSGAWRLWTKPPAEEPVPAEIDSIAVGPDGALLAAVYADPPRIGSFDGAVWEFEDGLAPASCNQGADCDVTLAVGRDGTAWVLFIDRIARDSRLWRRGPEVPWDRVALPEQLWEGSMGAGPGGTLWLMQFPRTAFFDGTAWTVWFQTDGPDGWGLWVGEDGTPWALEDVWGGGPYLWFFREERWSRVEPPLPDSEWPVTVASRGESLWVAAENRVWRFDDSTWSLQFEAQTTVSALAPAAGGAMWVAAGDLWLIGDGVPVLVAPTFDTWQLAPAPDGSVWALAGGGLYHVEYPG